MKLRLQLKSAFERRLARFIGRLDRAGLSPNMLTLTGGLLASAAAWPAFHGHFAWAGVVFLFGSLLDALDGPLARYQQRESAFGAVFDAVMDRIGEAAVLMALALYLALQGAIVWAWAALLAMLFSLLTSYLRAWGERFAVEMAADWLTRPERVALIAVGLISGYIKPMLALLLAITAVTTGMRLWRIARA